MSSKPPPYTPRAQRLPGIFPTGNTPPATPRPKLRNIDHFLNTPGEGPAMSGTTTQPVGTETKGKASEDPKTPSRPGSPNQGNSENPGDSGDPGNPGNPGNPGGPPSPPPNNNRNKPPPITGGLIASHHEKCGFAPCASGRIGRMRRTGKEWFNMTTGCN